MNFDKYIYDIEYLFILIYNNSFFDFNYELTNLRKIGIFPKKNIYGFKYIFWFFLIFTILSVLLSIVLVAFAC